MSRRARKPSRSRSRSPSKSREDSHDEPQKKRTRPQNQIVQSEVNESKKSVIGSFFSIGSNDLGQLGKDGAESSTDLVGCDDLGDVNALDFACGTNFNVVVEANNIPKYRTVYNWGTMSYTTGKNGVDRKTDDVKLTPTAVDALNKMWVVQAAAGDSHAAVLTLDGEVYVWGIYKSVEGPLGFNPDGSSQDIQEEPLLVEELPEPCIQIACTANKAIALTQGGEVFEWGDTKFHNENQRVTRNKTSSISPKRILFNDKITAVFCSSGVGNIPQIWGISKEGTVYGYGNNNDWQLGITKKSDVEEKEPDVDEEETILKSKRGKKAETKKTASKKKKDEGESEGTEEKKATKPRKKYKKEYTFKPVEAKAINELKETKDIKIKKICGGDNHTLLLTKDGEVYSWGSNEFGQTGHGDNERLVEEPRLIAGLENVVDIGCHSNYSIVVNGDGEVLGFGAIKSAGLPSNLDRDYNPVRICGVESKRKPAKVSCGKNHILVCTVSVK